MARLRVGDIEIDGQNITIGGVPQIGARVSAVPVAAAPAKLPTAPAPALPELLPVPPAALLAGGAATLAVSLVLISLGIFASVLLLPVGIGLGVLAVQQRHLGRRLVVARQQAEDAQLTAGARQIMPLLSAARPEQTVEWIAEKAHLPEATVVRTLAWLRRRGEIEEELDTETGDWYYRMAARGLPAGPRDLDARMQELEDEG